VDSHSKAVSSLLANWPIIVGSLEDMIINPEFEKFKTNITDLLKNLKDRKLLMTLKDIYDGIKIFSKNLQSTSGVLIGKESTKTTLLSTLQTLITKGSSEVGFLRSKKLVRSDRETLYTVRFFFFNNCSAVTFYSEKKLLNQ